MRNYQRLFQRRLSRFYVFAGCCCLLFVLLVAPLTASALTGRIVIAGYGPEQQVMQDLARAYEKLHPGTAIDVEWDRTVRAAEMVKTGECFCVDGGQPQVAAASSPFRGELASARPLPGRQASAPSRGSGTRSAAACRSSLRTSRRPGH